MTSPNSSPWTNRVVINLPSCKPKPGERAQWGSWPNMLQPEARKRKAYAVFRSLQRQALVSVRDRMQVWHGSGGGLLRVCQFGLTVSWPAATAVKQAPSREKKHKVNAGKGYIFFRHIHFEILHFRHLTRA